MKVLFAAAEIAPIAKVGGLADVVGALPLALNELGIETIVALPFYEFLKNGDLKVKKLLAFSMTFKGEMETVEVFRGKIKSTGAEIYLYDRISKVDHEVYGSAVMQKGLYINPAADLERFIFFSMAVAESLDKFKIKFDVVHCHDWHTGLIPFLLRNRTEKTLYTIHNLANQGVVDGMLEKLVGDKCLGLAKINGQYNLMATGITHAHLVNTVSQSYGSEILTKEFGCGLEKLLLAQKDKLSGIVNGIDIKMFDPKTDKHVYKNYDVANIEQKIHNKGELQRRVGLLEDKNVAVIGLVSRFVGQKGLDWFNDKAAKLKAQYVFLGEGDPVIEGELNVLAQKYSNVKIVKGFDLKLAQLIYAGSDFFLMPSKFEPCGLGQLISMRYGSLPIVNLVGGLKDTVRPAKGFGSVLKNEKDLALLIEKALTVFYAQPKKFLALQIRAMKGDYSWQKSSKKYVKLYTKLAKIR